MWHISPLLPFCVLLGRRERPIQDRPKEKGGINCLPLPPPPPPPRTQVWLDQERGDDLLLCQNEPPNTRDGFPTRQTLRLRGRMRGYLWRAAAFRSSEESRRRISFSSVFSVHIPAWHSFIWQSKNNVLKNRSNFVPRKRNLYCSSYLRLGTSFFSLVGGAQPIPFQEGVKKRTGGGKGEEEAW